MQAVQTPKRVFWVPVLVAWAFAVAMLLIRAFGTAAENPLINDADDAMRLVTAIDLMLGQNWFDHIQHRLNAPFGGELHWSHLVDLPIIALMKIFAFAQNPEFFAAIAYPLILLFGLILVCARMAQKMAGDAAITAGAILPILSAIILVEFAPGRVDHHNLQILLTVFMAFCAIQFTKNRVWPVMLGLTMATSLAIGTEALPSTLAGLICVAGFFVFSPSFNRQVALFGISLSGFAILHLAIALPHSQYFVPACDAISFSFVSAFVGIGLSFAVLAQLPAQSPVLRFVAGGAVATVLGVALLISFPTCLEGPYAGMDPWLKEHWLGRIVEAKPVWVSFFDLPAYTLAITIPPLLAFLVCIFAAVREKETRDAWMVLGVFLAVGLLITLLQVRGARLLSALVAPAGAYLIVWARVRYLQQQSLINILGMIGAWIGFAGVLISLAVGYIVPAGQSHDVVANAQELSNSGLTIARTDCISPQSFEALANLPAQRIMAQVDLGSHLLLFTHHEVVGASYHRVEQGVADTFAFFNESPDRAKQIAMERELDLMVYCEGMPEFQGFHNTHESAINRLLRKDDLPNWLQLHPQSSETIKIYTLEY